MCRSCKIQKKRLLGAQAKADAAENNAKSHANGLVGILSSLATTGKEQYCCSHQ